MYYSKKNVEPVPEEQTAVWSCSSDSCSCWMRLNFTFDHAPVCPICNSQMSRDEKWLPTIVNHTSTL